MSDTPEGQRRRLTAKRKAGICARCPAPAEPGRSRCRKHLDEARQRAADGRPPRIVREAPETTPERRAYAKRKRLGICQDCKVERAVRGLSRCAPCVQREAKRSSERYWGRLTDGICPKCGIVEIGGGAVHACSACRGLDTARRRERKAAGRCPKCGGERDREVQTCARCRESQTAADARRHGRFRSSGGCTLCGGERDDPDRSRCSTCRTNRRHRAGIQRERRRAAGLCGSCGRERDTPQRAMCSTCLAAARSRAARRRAAA